MSNFGDPIAQYDKAASSRWGDYSAMTVDPTNDCASWYTQQYIATTGDFNWNSRIADFRFINCR